MVDWRVYVCVSTRITIISWCFAYVNNILNIGMKLDTYILQNIIMIMNFAKNMYKRSTKSTLLGT